MDRYCLQGKKNPTPLLREKPKRWWYSTRGWKHSHAKLLFWCWQHLQVWKDSFQSLKCPCRLRTPGGTTVPGRQGLPGCTDWGDMVWYKTNPRRGAKGWVLHTNPHPSRYAAAETPNICFSTFWQQILFTHVHIHTRNYSIRTLFSTQKSFDRNCSICPNQWGLSISQSIFLNWHRWCQSGRTNSLDNLPPKAGTDLSVMLLLFLIKVTFKILLLFSRCCWERGREGGCMPAAESHAQS